MHNNRFLPVWIASFNGLPGEDCAIAVADGIAYNGIPSELCDSLLPVLCQDIPIVTVVEDDPITTVTVYDGKTKTKYIDPTCPSHPIKPCPCDHQHSEFVLLDGKLPYKQAACACHKLGLELADLTIGNFLEASQELWSHLGPRQDAWINSWNGDRYEHHDCLALWTGSTGPNGAIAVPRCCKQPNPVLCQRPHRPCLCKPEAPDCHCHRPHHRHHERHVFLEHKPPQEIEFELAKIGDDKCLHGKCPHVCKFHIGNIRVVKKAVGAYDAEETCRQFGWNLLDMSKYNQYQVAALQKKCGCDDLNMWIRSFEDVDGSACMFASPLLYGDCAKGGVEANTPGSLPSVAGYVFSADTCVSIGGLFVLCEKCERPAETSTGPYSGYFSTTTSTSSFTETRTHYTTTVTRTVTRR